MACGKVEVCSWFCGWAVTGDASRLLAVMQLRFLLEVNVCLWPGQAVPGVWPSWALVGRWRQLRAPCDTGRAQGVLLRSAHCASLPLPSLPAPRYSQKSPRCPHLGPAPSHLAVLGSGHGSLGAPGPACPGAPSPVRPLRGDQLPGPARPPPRSFRGLSRGWRSLRVCVCARASDSLGVLNVWFGREGVFGLHVGQLCTRGASCPLSLPLGHAGRRSRRPGLGRLPGGRVRDAQHELPGQRVLVKALLCPCFPTSQVLHSC